MRTRSRLTAPWRRRHTSDQRSAALAVPADEATVLAASDRGDLRAWEWLVRWNQELVFRSAYLTTGDSTLAEEATTLVFIHAHRSLRSRPPGTGFRPWLLRLTDSVATAQLREMSRRQDTRVVERAPTPRVPATPVYLAPGTPTPTRLEQDALIDGSNALTKEERNIIAARYAFGLERDDAAARMAVESEDVDGLLAAAVARLRSVALAATTSLVGAAGDQQPASVAPIRLGVIADDQLGSMAMVSVMSELRWTPDVAAIVCDRVAREDTAYPDLRLVVGDAAATSAETGGTASEQPLRRSGPSNPQAMVAILGVVLVAGAFAYGAGLMGQGADGSTDVRAALETMLGGWGADTTTEPESASATAPASQPDTTATAPGTSVTAPAPRPTSIDSWPSVSLVDARRLKGGALSGVIRVVWPTRMGSTTGAELEWQVGDSDWTSVAWEDTGDPLLVTIEPGETFGFRARATDTTGSVIASGVSRVKLGVRGVRSNLVDRSKRGWDTRKATSGRQGLIATKPGARVSTAFDGTHVAIVGPGGPSARVLDVRVDDGPWMRERTQGARSDSPVLYSEGLEQGEHTIDLRAVSDGLAVDAILIMRAQRA